RHRHRPLVVLDEVQVAGRDAHLLGELHLGESLVAAQSPYPVAQHGLRRHRPSSGVTAPISTAGGPAVYSLHSFTDACGAGVTSFHLGLQGLIDVSREWFTFRSRPGPGSSGSLSLDPAAPRGILAMTTFDVSRSTVRTPGRPPEGVRVRGELRAGWAEVLT